MAVTSPGPQVWNYNDSFLGELNRIKSVGVAEPFNDNNPASLISFILINVR